jgi:hypothetical protein
MFSDRLTNKRCLAERIQMKHSESKKPSFLSLLSFGLDLLPAVREGIFVIYATIALRMSVTLETVAGLLSEGWISHLVS